MKNKVRYLMIALVIVLLSMTLFSASAQRMAVSEGFRLNVRVAAPKKPVEEPVAAEEASGAEEAASAEETPGAEEPVEQAQSENAGEQAQQSAEAETQAEPAEKAAKSASAKSGIEVLAKAKKNAEVLTTVASADALTVLKTQGSWAKVSTPDGTVGYVSAKLVRKVAKKAEQPAEQPAGEAVEQPAGETVEQPAEQPTEEAVEQPTEEAAEQPAEETVEEAAEQPAEEAVEEAAEQPAEETVEQPAEEAAEQPAEEVTEQPEEEAAEQPAEEVSDKPADVKPAKAESKPAVEAETAEAAEEPAEATEEAETTEETEEPVEETEEPAEDIEERSALIVLSEDEAGDTVALYAEPDTSSAVLAKIPRGAMIGAQAIADEWSRVSYEDLTGYVHTGAIALYEAEAAEDEKVRSIRITSSLDGATTIAPGTLVTLTARLSGFENDSYTMQWYEAANGGEFEIMPGQTGMSITFPLGYDNINNRWRVTVDIVEAPKAE